MHKESRFVRDSGSMSATVGGCPLGVLTMKMIGLDHVRTRMLYQLIVTITKRVVKKMF